MKPAGPQRGRGSRRKARLRRLFLLLAAAAALLALASGLTLKNDALEVVLPDDALNGEDFFFKEKSETTDHMNLAKMGVSYNGTFHWFDDLTVAGDQTLRTSDGALEVKLDATEEDSAFFTVGITAENQATSSISNLAFFLAADPDIQDSAGDDEAAYTSDVDAVVAWEGDVYLGFNGSIPSSGHHLGAGGLDLFDAVEAGSLNGKNAFDPFDPDDVGIAQAWQLGDLDASGTSSMSIVWAFGSSLDDFEGNLIAGDKTAPTIQGDTLTAPNGDEHWRGGSTREITWESSDIADPTLKSNPITLEYWDGSDWVVIATDELNDGSFNWTIDIGADVTIPNSKVRITATDRATNSATDESDATFVLDSKPPTASLSYDPDRPVKDADTLVITATFSEAMASATGSAPTIAIDAPGTDGDVATTTMTHVSPANPDVLHDDFWKFEYDVPSGNGTSTVTINGQDLAGNPFSGPAANNTFTIDNTPPTVELSYAPAPAVKGGDTLTITATFSDAMAAKPKISIDAPSDSDDISSEDMDVVPGTGDKEWEFSYTPQGDEGDATVTIDGTDLAGNPNEAATNNTFAIDDTPPTLPADGIAGNTREGQGDTITLTFSEPVVPEDGAWSANEFTIKSPPDGDSFDLTNADFSPSTGSTQTLVITLDEATDDAFLVNGDTIRVTPVLGSIKDLAGNSTPFGFSQISTALNRGDDAAPTVELTYALDRPVRDADTLTITATFNEDMTFTPSGAVPTIAVDTPFVDLPATPMTASTTNRAVWTLAYDVPPESDGTATVTLSGRDLAGNLNLPATNNTFTIDNTPPEILAGSIVGTTIQATGTSTFAGDTIVLAFSEPVTPDDGTWSANEFASIQSPPGTSTALALDNATFAYDATTTTLTITLDEETDGAHLVNGKLIAITPASGQILDAALNPAAESEVVSTKETSGDDKPPTVALTYDPSRSVGESDTLVITATFSEAMTSATGSKPTIEITAGDGSILATSTAMTASTSSPAVWTFSYDVPGMDDATTTVTISGTDFAGNPLAQPASNNSFTIDNTPPALPAEGVVGTTIQGAGDTIKLAFGERVEPADGAWSANEFASIESPPGTSTALALDHATFSYDAATDALTITLDEAIDKAWLVNGNTISVTPATGAIKDGSGNPLADAPVTGTTPNSGDDQAPTVSLSYDPHRPVKDADTLVITATFSEAMTPATASAPTIKITAADGSVLATSTAMTASTSSPAVWTFDFDVSAGNDGAATVTIDGTDLAGNASEPATNDTFSIDNTPPTLPAGNIVGTTVQDGGDTITLEFSEPVAPEDGTWSANEFAAIESPDGTAITLTNAAFAYDATTTTLTITLDEAADKAWLRNGNIIAVTPATGVVVDAASNPLSDSKVVGTVVNSGDSVRPDATLAYDPNRAVRQGEVLRITASFTEDMTPKPTIAIDTPGADLAPTDMAMAGNRMTWTFDYTIPAGVNGIATVSIAGADLAGNRVQQTFNTEFEINNTAPGLTLTSTAPDPALTSPIPVRAEFTAPVTGFTVNDITVTNGTVSNFQTVSGSVYTFEVTPDDPGEVTVNVAADAAQDTAGNGNAAAPELSRTFAPDATAPTVSLSSSAPDPAKSSPIPVTATFSEPVTGFTAGDVTVGNGIAGSFQALSETVYTFVVTPGGEGLVTVDIPADVAEDAAGNGNTAASQLSLTFSLDNTAPSLALSSTAPDPTSASPIPVTATFSEDVTGFEAADIGVANGTVSNFQALSGSEYTFDVAPTGQGLVTVEVAAGVAQDAAGNDSTAATRLQRTFDTAVPGVTLSSGAPDPTRASPIPVTATFSKAVTGFTAGDISVTNGTVINFQAVSGSVYTFEVTPAAQGQVTVDIGAGAAQDAAGNGNTAAAQLIRSFDDIAPTVTLTSTATDPTGASPIPVTATFSEDVTGFEAGDISVTNGTVGNFQPVSGSEYNFDVTPDGPGEVTVDVAADVAQDDAGNGNATAQLTRTFAPADSQPAPLMQVTAPNGGESWTIGSTQAITWSSTLGGSVRIEMSRDGGASWITLVRRTPNDGRFELTVSGPATDEARVRVTSNANPSASDASDAGFAITGGAGDGGGDSGGGGQPAGEGLTLTSPAGGESWAIGSRQAITWSAAGLGGSVRIELSRDGGASWITLVRRTPNDGRFMWTVSGPATSEARLRVISNADPSRADMSDADFTIGS